MRIASPATDIEAPIHTSRLLANDAQRSAGHARTRDHRIAVHGRVIERRKRDAREIITRRKAANRIDQPDGTARGKGWTAPRMRASASSC